MDKSNITSKDDSTLLTNQDLIENKVLEYDQLANDLETLENEN